MSARQTCRICGKKTRYRDGICQTCRDIPLPDPETSDSTDFNSDHPKKKLNLKGMFIMFKKYLLPILGLIGSVITLIISVIVLPLIMGGWAIACLIGSGLGIIGAGLVLYSRQERSTPSIDNIKNYVCGAGLTLFLGTLLIWGCISGCKTFAATKVASTTKLATVTGTLNNTAKTASNTVVPVVHSGLDQPSKSWFLAKAGTLISGDVAIFDNDNNSKKTPVYDSKENTADVIYLTSDTYIWTEWGCHFIEDANAQDVTNIINDKLTHGNFTSIRYFNGYSKLGTNTPTIISSQINASSITLPSLTTAKTSK